MKVLHYCQHALVGQTGVANSARGWCEALARLGVDVTLVVDRALAHLDPVPGVSCVPLPHRRLGPVAVPLGIEPLLRDVDVVVLHGGWHPGNTAVALRAAGVGTPYVVLTHGVYFPAALHRSRWRKQAWAALSERRMLHRAAAIHLLFAEEQEGLSQLGVCRPTIVAPNGVTPPPVRWDGGSGGYLLFLGRYDVVHKGLDILLDGLAALPPDERPRLRLHGPDAHGGRREVGALAERLGVAAHVDARGPIHDDHKWDVLRAARGLVLTSRWEASPMSLAEAAAAGVPSLVTPFAMGRWLADRGGALCVEPSPDAVARGLRALGTDRAQRVGARAHEVARDELTWAAVARSWLAQARPLVAGR